MSNYHKLLLVLDPDKPLGRVLAYAVELARAHGAVLHICVPVMLATSVESTGAPERSLENKLHLARVQAWLQAGLAQLGSSIHGVSIVAIYPWSLSLHDSLIDTQERVDPDLLIKLQEEYSLDGRPFIMPLDWRLLRECRAPVLLQSAAAVHGPEKVMAALDLVAQGQGPSLDEQVVRAALQLAAPFGAAVHLVHAFDFASMAGWNHEMATQRRHCEARLARIAGYHAIPAQNCHLLDGRPLATLSHLVVPQQCDVMVIGRSPHEALDTCLGNTAERIVARHPACCLLVVGALDHPSLPRSGWRSLRERLDSLVGVLFAD
ncbi:universal stress protein [Pseudomonas sp. Pseusp122]|uniref:universal stress protein n=1 Tax=unclassified Pseudomonas TaxID=196821 RepID=UPI0039A6CD8F